MWGYLRRRVGVQILAAVLAMAHGTGCSSGGKEALFGPAREKATSADKIKPGEENFSFKSDEGETVISTKKISEGDIDVPFYPGAVQDDSGSLSVNKRFGIDADQWTMVALRTPDPFEKVANFYKEKLREAEALETPADASKTRSDGDRTLTLIKNKGEKHPVTTVRISRKPGDNETLINITCGSGK